MRSAPRYHLTGIKPRAELDVGPLSLPEPADVYRRDRAQRLLSDLQNGIWSKILSKSQTKRKSLSQALSATERSTGSQLDPFTVNMIGLHDGGPRGVRQASRLFIPLIDTGSILSIFCDQVTDAFDKGGLFRWQPVG